MARPWFNWYPGDYQRDTAHLTDFQDLAYRRLIDAYYMRRGLPNDDRQLARIVGCDLRTWRKNRAAVEAFFYGEWKHRRIDLEIQKAEALHEKRKLAGSKGGTVAAMNAFKSRFRSM